MPSSSRPLAALALSLVILAAGFALPASAVTLARPAINQQAPFNPNPFRGLYRFLKRLIGAPTDGGQIDPPHP